MTMSSIQFLDGGLGTSLEDSYGIKFDDSTPLWSSHLLIANQETLLACQRDFVDAGVDVLLTATYQVSIEGFANTKTAEFPDGIPLSAVPRFLHAALEVAEKARAGGLTKLALSLGPYGACMVPGQEYSGKYDADHDSEEKLFQWHLERLRLFTAVKGFMDRMQYVAFETIPRLDEIRAVRRAAHAAGIRRPFWVSCVYPGEATGLPDRSSVEQVIQTMLEDMEDGDTPWGIGINCTKIDKLATLIKSYETAVQRLRGPTPALVLYPDGTTGEVYNTATKRWEMPSGGDQKSKESWSTQLASIVGETQHRGYFNNFLVGGCCKASASDIKALHDQFDRVRRR